MLANILGETEGLFAAGEVRYLWDRGLVEGRRCGCGLPVPECPIWSEVLTVAGARDPLPDPAVMVRSLRHLGRVRRLPGMLAGQSWPRLDPVRGPHAATGRSALARLYPAIAEVSGASVVVDSSKLPAYANLLRTVPGIDLRVVHLTRDPRGAAHSWAGRKPLEDGAGRTHMEQIGPARSAVLWDVWNLAGAALLDRGPDRYLRLRYEDFVADPETSVRRILALVGRGDATLPFLETGEVRLGVNHCVAGNPDRLRHGPVVLRSDDRWLTAMRARDRRVVSALTAPLLRRHGYPLRPQAPARAARSETIYDRAPAGEGKRSRTTRRLRRHLRWGRVEGFARLAEEDELNPVTRVTVAASKWRWRRAHPVAAGLAARVYLVGLQRSGTNMLARGLDVAPEFEVHNENNSHAFVNFQLRSDAVVRRIVLASRHRYVLFKPLCDSHRVDALLDGLDTPTPGRAIWAYRDVDGRVRSAVSKFGRNNLLVLGDIAAGRGAGMWQAERIPAQSMELLRSFDFSTMSPESAAALFWWVRNSLYFDIGLDSRQDVLLASYQDLIAEPEAAMKAICGFLDLDYRPALIAHISRRDSAQRRPLEIDPRVRALCDQLQARLDQLIIRRRRGWAA